MHLHCIGPLIQTRQQHATIYLISPPWNDDKRTRQRANNSDAPFPAARRMITDNGLALFNLTWNPRKCAGFKKINIYLCGRKGNLGWIALTIELSTHSGMVWVASHCFIHCKNTKFGKGAQPRTLVTILVPLVHGARVLNIAPSSSRWCYRYKVLISTCSMLHANNTKWCWIKDV